MRANNKPVVSEAIMAVVQRAINSPAGISIEFPTVGAAIHFHQRYNNVRKHVVQGKPDHEWRTIGATRQENILFLRPIDEELKELKITELETKSLTSDS